MEGKEKDLYKGKQIKRNCNLLGKAAVIIGSKS